MADPTLPSVSTAHQIQFNNYLVEFIKKLQTILPEFKRPLTRYYHYYRQFVQKDQRIEFIEEFIHYLSIYNKEIATRDEGLFSEEAQYYPHKPIQLLKSIDFKLIWRIETLTLASKESIWQYLQTLYLIGSYALKETQRFQQLLEQQKNIINGLIQSLQAEKKIQEDAQQPEPIDNNDTSAITELFGESNLITEMAMEVAKDLHLPKEQLTDPIQAIKLLFGQDGTRLQEIVSRVGSKLQNKMQNTGITSDHFVSDAKRMNERLLNKFKGVPGMPDIEKFSRNVADQVKHNMDIKQQNNGTNNALPDIDVLTQCLGENLSQLGFTNVEEFKLKMSGEHT